MSADASTSTPSGSAAAAPPPGRPSRWRDRNGLRPEIVAFVFVPLLVLAGVAATTVYLSERIARANALAQAEQITDRFARLLLAPLLEDALTDQPDQPDRRAELEYIVTNRLSDGSIRSLVVWATDGEILFASDEDSIGERYEPSADLLAAADGRVVSDVDTKPESSYTGQATGPMVEVYVPLDLEDERVVVEAYFSDDGIEEQAERLRWQLIPLAVGALVVLQLLQLPIAMSLTRRARRQETERAELMARTLTASERERRAIAADVHDGPVQDLAGVSYALSALRASVPDERKATVDRLVSAVRNAVHSLRGLMVDLYPPDLRGAGLEAALEDLVEPLRGEGVSAVVRTASLPELSPDSAAVIYRTAKELLTNVSSHARATTVWVDVEAVEHLRAPAVRLTVSDDGVGFPEAGTNRRREGHLGLQFVADRVRDAGGTFVLADRPGGGASVTAVIPVGFVP